MYLSFKLLLQILPYNKSILYQLYQLYSILEANLYMLVYQM